MNKIEAVIVSFNCVDLLSITLPRNLPELDHVIIVTKPEDKETIEYCQSLGTDKITILKTEAFTYEGAKFNKGLAINIGLQYLKYKDWVILMDTDVVFIENFRAKFLNSAQNIEYGYGSRRFCIETREEWNKFINKEKTEKDYVLFRGHSYGYFYAFNYNSVIFQDLNRKTKGLPYPYWFPIANECDWIFHFNWGEIKYDPPLSEFPRCHSEKHQDSSSRFLKELPFSVCHLGYVGLNHAQRETPKF